MTTATQAAGAMQRIASPAKSPSRGKQQLGIGFMVPFGIFFVAFLVVPILYGIYLSFTNESLTGAGAGEYSFRNYAEAFGDAEVWSSMLNTVWFTVLSTVPLILVALVMALLTDLGLPGQWLWRLAFFAPFLLPVTVVTLIWAWMYQPDLGLINDTLGRFGLSGVGWLSGERIAMWSIAIVTTWWTVGFNFLLYLSALQAIPHQLYEAASLDGAGGWRQLWSVTLPLLRRTTGLVLVLQILASLKVFDQIYQLTGGGPNGATRSILEYVYDTGFTGYRLGYASAISYIFFAIIVIISIAQLKLFTRREA